MTRRGCVREPSGGNKARSARARLGVQMSLRRANAPASAPVTAGGGGGGDGDSRLRSVLAAGHTAGLGLALAPASAPTAGPADGWESCSVTSDSSLSLSLSSDDSLGSLAEGLGSDEELVMSGMDVDGTDGRASRLAGAVGRKAKSAVSAAGRAASKSAKKAARAAKKKAAKAVKRAAQRAGGAAKRVKNRAVEAVDRLDKWASNTDPETVRKFERGLAAIRGMTPKTEAYRNQRAALYTLFGKFMDDYRNRHSDKYADFKRWRAELVAL